MRNSDNCEETSGTPGYMSPEVICRMNHSYEADFFALGVIAYEMVTGTVRFELFSVHTWEIPENKSDKRYWLIKPKLLKTSFPKAGGSSAQTSSTS